MAGNKVSDNEELLISPALLEHLFRPLQEVLKENGEAIIELTNQMKVVVTLITSHPTRLTITEQLEKHNEQALNILNEVKAARSGLYKFMLTLGLIWAAVETIQSYHIFSWFK